MENNGDTPFTAIENILDFRGTSPSGEYRAVKFKSRRQCVWITTAEFEELNYKLKAFENGVRAKLELERLEQAGKEESDERD